MPAQIIFDCLDTTRSKTLSPRIKNNMFALTTALKGAGDTAAIIKAVDDNADISRDLGFSFENKRLERRIQARTDPATYFAERKAEVDKIIPALKFNFGRNVKAYMGVGLPSEQAVAMARQMMVSEKAMALQAVNLAFPLDSNNIADASTKRVFDTQTSAGGSDRAPARKRAAPRRRAAPRKRAPTRKRK
jgi:hypothetical protein